MNNKQIVYLICATIFVANLLVVTIVTSDEVHTWYFFASLFLSSLSAAFAAYLPTSLKNSSSVIASIGIWIGFSVVLFVLSEASLVAAIFGKEKLAISLAVIAVSSYVFAFSYSTLASRVIVHASTAGAVKCSAKVLAQQLMTLARRCDDDELSKLMLALADDCAYLPSDSQNGMSFIQRPISTLIRDIEMQIANEGYTEARDTLQKIRDSISDIAADIKLTRTTV
jgi:hypothetical protein